MVNIRTRAELVARGWRLLRAREYFQLEKLLGSYERNALLKEPELGYLLSASWFRVGKPQLAFELLLQLEKPVRQCGNTWLFRTWLNFLGVLYGQLGRLQEAQSAFSELFIAAGAATDEHHAALGWINSGGIYGMQGYYEDGLAMTQRGMAAFQRRGESRFVGAGHQITAMCYRELGKSHVALSHFDHAYRLLENYGSADETARVELERAVLLMRIHDYKLASSSLDRAVDLFARTAAPVHLGEVTRVRALLALSQSNLVEARKLLEDALVIARASASPLLSGEVLEELVMIDRIEGKEGTVTERIFAAEREYLSIGAKPRAERMHARLAAIGEGAARASEGSGATKGKDETPRGS